MNDVYTTVFDGQIATGLLVTVRTPVIKTFLSSIPGEKKTEVLVDFDGVRKQFSLAEFKNALFPLISLATTAEPAPAYERPLQALRVAGMKDQILSGTKKITIREGYRDYTTDKVLIGDEKDGWCVLKKITKVQWKLLKEVTNEEMKADGFMTQKDMLNGLKVFYPEMELHMPVTMIEWE